MVHQSFKLTGLLLLVCVVRVDGQSIEQELITNQIAAEPQRLRILVTNDDGINSPGLAELVGALTQVADIVVCAPNSNRSGAGQSVPSLSRPMTVEEVNFDGAEIAIAVSGSPADAVCYAMVTLGDERPFDLVVSGINSSANVGDQSHSSGTVGAAMEGVYRGIPSIAVSQGGGSRDYAFAARFAAQFAEKLHAHGATEGVVYSINVPTGNPDEIRGVAVRPMGGTQISVMGYTTRDEADGVRTVQADLHFESSGPAESDSEAFFEGYVTVTPLRFDWTAYEAIEQVEGWNLTIE